MTTRARRHYDGYAPPNSPENRDAIARFALVMAGGFLILGIVVLTSLWLAGEGERRPGAGPRPRRAYQRSAGFCLLFPTRIGFQRLSLPWLHAVPIIATVMVVVIGIPLGQALKSAVIVALVISVIIVPVAMTLRAALVHLVHLSIGYMIILRANESIVPVARWAGTMGGAVIVASVVEWLVGRNRGLARAEHDRVGRSGGGPLGAGPAERDP